MDLFYVYVASFRVSTKRRSLSLTLAWILIKKWIALSRMYLKKGVVSSCTYICVPYIDSASTTVPLYSTVLVITMPITAVIIREVKGIPICVCMYVCVCVYYSVTAILQIPLYAYIIVTAMHGGCN